MNSKLQKNEKKIQEQSVFFLVTNIISVFYPCVMFREELTFLVFWTKKDKIGALKKAFFKHLGGPILYFPHYIWVEHTTMYVTKK